MMESMAIIRIVTMWGPLVISWFITPITMAYGTYNYSYWGESKPTYNWGASHCRNTIEIVIAKKKWP